VRVRLLDGVLDGVLEGEGGGCTDPSSALAVDTASLYCPGIPDAFKSSCTAGLTGAGIPSLLGNGAVNTAETGLSPSSLKLAL
jgi:hypothetical protein